MSKQRWILEGRVIGSEWMTIIKPKRKRKDVSVPFKQNRADHMNDAEFRVRMVNV